MAQCSVPTEAVLWLFAVISPLSIYLSAYRGIFTKEKISHPSSICDGERGGEGEEEGSTPTDVCVLGGLGVTAVSNRQRRQMLPQER